MTNTSLHSRILAPSNLIQIYGPDYSVIALFFLCGHPAQTYPNDKGEDIHWWISGSEAITLQTIIDAVEKQGYQWIGTPVQTVFHANVAKPI